ncbi:MAG: glycosyltransferase [Bacteroidetes bacterium HGW-Bacteroidetes-12]|nr:MAG: glycosyltransferase [Bacteroidetes bacterium HGW-Bacteroidetes-12]
MIKNSKKIVVCPLDWGLGHAARCVPIINALIDLEHEVIIAADKAPLSFLKTTFPQLKFVQLPGYIIRYTTNGRMSLKMLQQLPGLLRSIKKEHQLLQNIINEYKIDLVISDNRYGCWSEKVPSIFITHQLFIQAPYGKKWLNKINHHFIQKFNECWVPDGEGKNNLSGNLSHTKKLNATPTFFIGPLSRFSGKDSFLELKYDAFIIISGPEPQRTVFESLVAKQAKKTALKLVVVRGLPSENKIPEYLQLKNLEVHNHLATELFLGKLSQSNLVISRAGYSTIMDLAVLGKKAVLVPTPGQTEQEYLAKYHVEKQHYFTQTQQEFDLEEAIKKASNFKGILLKNQFDLSGFLSERIASLK